jgi:hypothetical protein
MPGPTIARPVGFAGLDFPFIARRRTRLQGLPVSRVKNSCGETRALQVLQLFSSDRRHANCRTLVPKKRVPPNPMPKSPHDTLALAAETSSEKPSGDPGAPREPQRAPVEEPLVHDPVDDPVPQYPPGDDPAQPGHTPTSPPPISA